MLTRYLVAEGYRIDHFGNAVSTTYVDMREPAAQHPIPALPDSEFLRRWPNCPGVSPLLYSAIEAGQVAQPVRAPR